MSNPSPFTLPEGYTLADIAPDAAVLGDVPGFLEYGGATVTQLWDASGAHYIGICAKDAAGIFLFRVFKEVAPEQWSEIVLPDKCDGRGSIAVHRYTGECRYIAWRGAQFFQGLIPGAAHFAVGEGGLDLQAIKGALWSDSWFRGDWLLYALTWGADSRVVQALSALDDVALHGLAALEARVASLEAKTHAAGVALV